MTNTTTNPFTIGDILICEWGWEQTNVDFYQVVRTTTKSVWIRQINHTADQVAYDEYHVEPIADSFIDDNEKGELHRVCYSGSEPYLHMNSYSIATRYAGQNILETTYA